MLQLLPLLSVGVGRVDFTLHPLGTPIRLYGPGELARELALQNGGAPDYPFSKFSPAFVEEALAATVDWRDFGGKRAVTPAKDQGPHGYCGTFGRVAAAEGQFALHAAGKPALTNFSEEQMVDCVGWDLDQGAVITDGHTGFMTSEAYPYNDTCATPERCDADPPVPNNPCRFTHPAQKVVGSDGFTNSTSVPGSAGEEQFAAFIYRNGPVQAGIYAPVFGLRDNATCGGVGGGCWVTAESCASVKGQNIDHSITLVGFGHDATVDQKTGKAYGDYWLVKNSWSLAFADQGFVKLARGVECGGILEAGVNLFTYGDPAKYYQ